MRNYLIQKTVYRKNYYRLFCPKYLFVWFLLFSFSVVYSQNVEKGRNIYNQKCISCHTIGKGEIVGPDLENITEKRDRNWLKRFILKPEKMIAEGDSLANALLQQFNNIPMPNQGLNEQETKSILLYLEQQSESEKSESGETQAKTGTVQKKQETVEPLGDLRAGKKLFTGAKSFQNNGPNCVSCHSIAGLPFSGGGSLGPDLSVAIEKFGRQGLKSVLTNIAFPTMRPLYQNKSLTESEVQDLLAYIQENQKPQQASFNTMSLIWLAILGAIIFIVIIQLIWRNRLNPAEWQLKSKKSTKEE